MTLLLLLLTAHFIGDFYLQPAAWIDNRHAYGIRAAALYKHSLVHFILALIALLIADYSVMQACLWGAIIAVTHWLIDWAKSGRHGLKAFILDQIAHFIVVIAVTVFLSQITVETLLALAKTLRQPEKLIYILGYILILNPASILIAQILSRHTKILAAAENRSLGDAGRWIGYVERTLALSFILVGQYTGLGFLVATKTVFRIGDLSKAKDMRLTEYMMLGTLFSFALALIVGWVIIAIVPNLA
ncbi:DUF3307 domain-containing protein [Salinimonas chungwhensis]|uniref:DUF3307 domain-containing protein n=1 Tax=Salinimonas chungwhensis TaxID=265425 RepID=UPI00037F8A13|nr:DUF3307 domain-containing protein [Salinimonas chungwhensis]